MATITKEQIEAAEKNLAWMKSQGIKLAGGQAGLCAPCEPSNVPPRRPQVHEDLAELGYAIDSLEKAIGGLCERLSSVTCTLPSYPTCSPEAAEPQKVPLANIISEYRKRVRSFQDIVMGLTERLEV